MNARRIFVDMDGTLAKWQSVTDFARLYEERYYYDLAPNISLINLLKEEIRLGESIYILSSYLADSLYALAEKQAWLDKYLPDIKAQHRLFVKYGESKASVFSQGIGAQDYLIDDYTKKLLEWKRSGGTGIKYLNGINHTQRTWRGFLLAGTSQHLKNDLDKILSSQRK